MIKVEKSLHMENAHVINVSYVSVSKPRMIQTVSTSMDAACFNEGGTMVMSSEDNGATWQEKGVWTCEGEESPTLVWHGPAYYLDMDNGALVEFTSSNEQAPGRLTFIPGENKYDVIAKSRLWYYRISLDEGTTWGPRKQFVQTGAGYDKDHWAEGIWYGKNSAYPSPGGITKAQDGSLILCASVIPVDENGSIIRCIDRFGTEEWPTEHAACFCGKWRDDLSDIDWTMSNQVSVPEYMSLSLTEPVVAEMDDGILMMVMRGNSTGRQALPGVKWFCVSRDSGQHWGPAVPLTYPDGSYVNSPGSIPDLFRSSKNGKVYLIANISDNPCAGSDPRHPLIIAEIDKKFLWLLPNSPVTIAARQEHHPHFVRFSNWARYEDRETKDQVVYMTDANVDKIVRHHYRDGTVLPHSYRYDIRFVTD